MKLWMVGCLFVGTMFILCRALPVCAETNGVAATPQMGWSTWSFLRKSPTEAAVEAQALAMHNSGLQSHGFVYVNLDDFYYYNPSTTVDAYGRWAVSSSAFPDGIAAVAAYVHSLGLKFGIYVTAGIPVAAYNQNTPILGTTNHAQDIVTSTSSFEVNYNFTHCMYHIDYTRPGAQAFVNSWANLYASWGVDYLNIDGVGDSDIDDIEAWSQALVQTGRPIHFELSNNLDVNNGSLWRQYVNGWRIDGDIECYCSSTSYPLTSWANVMTRFTDAPKWTQFGGSGGWNDLDSIEIGNGTNDGLTTIQKQAALTLWSICCAPLILGTDLTQLNTNDLPLIFNNNVLQVDQAGSVGAPLTYNTTTQVWRAAEADGSYAVAFFNLGSSAENVSVTWSQLGFTNAAEVQDLWAGTDLGGQTSGYGASVPANGTTFYRVAPVFPAFRYLANTTANVIGGGAYLTNSTELSGGLKAVYVGLGGTVTFNNVMAPTAGTYNVTFLYENGDATSRNANLSINGGSAIPVAFGPSGSFTTLASQTIAVSLQSGSNSIAISNPTAYAPDFDSLVVQSEVTVTPSIPTGVTVAGGLSQATLFWLVSGGASGYQVKFGTASGNYTATNTTATAGLTVAGLTNGMVYYFAVTATNSAGTSSNSMEVSALVGSPAAPTNLVAAAGNAQVALQWSPSFGATSYNLKRSTTSGGSYTVIVSQAGTSYTDVLVTNGTTYYYVVSALNGSAEGSNSTQVSVVPVLTNGTYKVVNQLSGLALDDPNGGGTGTGADQQPYSGTNQQWTIASVGGANYKIIAANGYALSGPTASTQLTLSSYTGTANQLWTFQASGPAFILHNVGSGQVMDDYNNGTTAGTIVDQWVANGGINQNWLVTPAGASAFLTWKGDGVTNNWDVQTTTNWINAGNPDVFYQGELVTFDDTGSNTPPINLATVLSPGGVTVNATQNYTFNGGGQLSGGMILIKSGTGTLFLQTTNTFSGSTTINAGTLKISGTGQLNSGVYAGTITDNGILDYASSASQTLSAAVTGTGGLTVDNGSMTLSATEAYTGPTVVNGGTLGLNAGNNPNSGLYKSSGLTINSGGTVLIDFDNSLAGSTSTLGDCPVTINAGGLLTGTAANYSPNNGGGTSSHIRGVLTLNGGTLANGGTGTGSYIAKWGTWNLDDGVAVGVPTPSATTSTISAIGVMLTQATATTFNVASGSTSSGIDLNVTGTLIATSGGSGAPTITPLIKTGNGTMSLSGANTYTSATTVSAGTLMAGANAPSGSAGAFGNATSAITVGNANTTVNNSSPSLLINGAFTVGRAVTVANQGTAGTYSIGGSLDTNATFAGVITVNEPLTIVQAINATSNALTISGGIVSSNGLQVLTFAGPGNVNVNTSAIANGSGQMAVNVSGGKVNLTAANTYTGTTAVSNGTLLVNGSLVAGSVVTIGAGGMLGGNGTINGPATVQSGGTLSPGGSLSTLTFNSSLTLNAGSTSFFEISKSPVTNDVAKVSTALTCGGTLIVTNIGSTALTNGDSFHLFSATTNYGAFAHVLLPPLPAGLAWNTSALNAAGTLSVMVAPHPVISSVSISGGGLIFNGNSGAGYGNFYVLGSTNLAAPVSNWMRILTNQFDAGGGFNFTNAMNGNLPCGFYLLQLP